MLFKNDFDKLKVCVIAVDNSGCGNYRVIIPYNELINKGYKQFKIYNHTPSFEILKQFDVILFQRVVDYNPLPFLPPYYLPLNLMKELKALGKVIIHEVDDNLMILPPHNPSYHDYKPNSEPIKYHKEALRLADFIHCTNDNLKNSISELLNINKGKIYTFDNAVDVNYIYYKNRRSELPQDKIIIGYQGGSSHEKDLQILVEPVRKILKKYGNVMFGFCSNPYYLKYFNLPKDRVIQIPIENNFNKFLSIPSMFDIGLVPLIDDDFNRCKSQLKIHEYGIYSIPTICSSVSIYDVKDGVNLLANNNKNDWFKNIEMLILDEQKRKEIGENAYKYCTSNFSSNSLYNINNKRIEFYRTCI